MNACVAATSRGAPSAEAGAPRARTNSNIGSARTPIQGYLLLATRKAGSRERFTPPLRYARALGHLERQLGQAAPTAPAPVARRAPARRALPAGDEAVRRRLRAGARRRT